ncbi:MAG: tRNA (adenosine(37)-N6)-dimethylallyltransferase MiaA [Candidatus Marinimicrobia bacterium]|nr:tRNA (adenosine(37)-N6)-dimethylallyltransferase MiaA [Candidatus Neomarinimicrobiota bacterium]
MKYFIKTFGCEANKADSERIAWKLESEGHKKAKSEKEAKLIVINACSVRQSAIDRVYGKIKNLSSKKIILAGCVLDRDIKKFSEKVDEIWHPDEYFDLKPIYSNPFSAFVPITKGCDNFCTYCAVPHTRGREKSRQAKDIIGEVQELVKNGYKEIWLLGQNVNSYKSQIQNYKSQINSKSKKTNYKQINFAKLLKEINNIPGDFWIRFTSPHPKDFSDELINTIAKCDKATNYINLPVQSGDNDILKKMNRHYTRDHYINLVNKIRKKNPDIAISTDTIVGFCGETREQFNNTVDLYKKVKFDMAFIARYSPRPGTVSATKMEDTVSHKEKERRRLTLTKILEKTALEHNKKLVGQEIKVLVDSKKGNKFFGRSEGNKVIEMIEVEPNSLEIGKFFNVKITEASAWKLKGKIVHPKIIIVLGPTASGKSDLAVDIACEFGNMEIISADSRQVYKGMDIGSGKITKKEMKNIPHHLLDVVTPAKKIFTAGDFKKLSQKAIDEILDKGKTPIVCGGTGFYIHALFNEFDTTGIEPDWKLREKLEKKNTDELFKILKKLDSKRAKNIDAKNKRRLIRAIEVLKSKNKFKFTLPQDVKDVNYDVLYLGIKREHKNLRKLIHNRLLRRFDEGMIAEVKRLHKKGVSWKKLDDFGLEYRFISRYLRKIITKEEMIDQLETAIVQFSKRQMTWFKKYAPKTIWTKNQKETFRLVKKFLEK